MTAAIKDQTDTTYNGFVTTAKHLYNCFVRTSKTTAAVKNETCSNYVRYWAVNHVTSTGTVKL